MIRLFCQVAPSPVGDLGYDYLTELAKLVKVRAIPSGPAAALGFEKRWWKAGNLFTAPLSLPYVNVVCVPIGTPMGVRAPAATMGTPDDLPDDIPPELRAAMIRGAKKAAAREATQKAVVYEPVTVLEGLYTVGCKNVAIVVINGAGGHIDHKEIATLGKYDLVISPRPSDVSTLAAQGVQAVHLEAYRANELVIQLERLCLCAFDTTATSETSRGSAEPPGTISSLSSTTATSTSRSGRSASRDATPTPSPGTKPSTATSDSSSPAAASPTWKSFIRRLAFWKR